MLKVKGLYTREDSPFYWFEFEIGGDRFRESSETANAKKALKKKDDRKVEEQNRLRKLKEAGGAKGAPRTLGEAFDRIEEEVLQHMPSQAAAKDTIRDMARILNWRNESGRFPLGKNKLLTEISDNDITKLVAWRRAHYRWGDEKAGRISNTEVNGSTVDVMRRVFVRAREVWKMSLPNCPNWRAHTLPVSKVRPRTLSKAENEALCASMKPDYNEVRLFSLASGFRQKECLLTWSEVDWEARVITVTGKGGKELRRPITTEMERILFRQRGKHDQYVFTACAGISRGQDRKQGERYPINLEGLKAEWRRARAEAAKTVPSLVDPTRKKSLRFHDHRHTFGSRIAKHCKGNPAVIMAAMGHSSWKSTERYIHALDDDVLVAMEAASSQNAG